MVSDTSGESLYVSGSSPDFPTNYGEVAQGGRASVVRQIQVGTHTIFLLKRLLNYIGLKVLIWQRIGWMRGLS